MIEQKVQLRLCTVVASSGETMQPFVRCPRRGKTIDALLCTGCARMRSLEWDPAHGGEVICSLDDDDGRPPLDGRADIAEAAARALVHEVTAPVTTCVTLDLPITRLRALFAEKGLRNAPVVDADGKLEGLVWRADLMAAPNAATTAEVMTECVHALPEDAPISSAIALMAFEELTEVPIVSADGAVIGVCRAFDALRWLAQRMGFVGSPRTDAQATE